MNVALFRLPSAYRSGDERMAFEKVFNILALNRFVLRAIYPLPRIGYVIQVPGIADSL